MSRLLGAAFAGGASSVAVVIATSIPSALAEERRFAGLQQTLTSVAANLRVESWRASGDGGGSGAAWSVSKDTLHGGRQEGVDVITVDNGRLRFTVVPTRGMSLGSLTATTAKPAGKPGAVSVGWQSPVREVVHPMFMDLAQGGGLGWLTGFNEFLVRCGVAHAGHPGPDTGGALKTLHGRVGNIPASEVEVVVDAEAPHTIRVRGRVDEQMFKFCDFELWTEVATVPGSDVLTVVDRLVNKSAYPKEFELIYHTNFGPGAGLEAGATFLAPTATVTPFNAEAAADLIGANAARQAKDEEAWRTFLGPTRGFGERVYKVTTHADASTGTSVAALVSAAGDRGVALTYSAKSLPCFTLWKNTDVVEEGYVAGLEPGTSFCHPMSHERAKGRVPILPPGGEQRFALQVRVLRSAGDVADVRAEVSRLAAGRAPQVLELEL